MSNKHKDVNHLAQYTPTKAGIRHYYLVNKPKKEDVKHPDNKTTKALINIPFIKNSRITKMFKNLFNK